MIEYDRDRVEIIPGQAFGVLVFQRESWRYTRNREGVLRVFRWTHDYRGKRAFIGWKRVKLADVPEHVKRGIGLLAK